MSKRKIEKLAKKERKKLLKSDEHETAGPMAMQSPHEGHVADSRRDQPDPDANNLGRGFEKRSD